jgi:steroid 5-alpha reductase family enzyme
MDMLAEVVAPVLAAVAIYMLLFWLVSLVLRDVSIVDIGWGLGFVLIAWVAHRSGRAEGTRPLLQAILVTIWGVRLAIYLLIRNWGQPEDYRYAAMRKRVGPAYSYLSLVLVFGLQGVLMLCVSLPVMAVQASAGESPLGLLDALAVAMFGVGFFFEVTGDRQLAKFKSDPDNRGKLLQHGVWAWTRHPNYFGDALQWWAFGAFALAVPGAAWTLLGPALMTFLLLRISGVALLERGLRKRKVDYEAYAARTPAFIPRPPRRAK